MNKIFNFTIRNLKHYYRDKSALFFSFMNVFIIVSLYIFFLADMQEENIKNMASQIENVEQIIYSWIVGGLVCVPAVSVPLIVLTFKVNDAIDGVQEDLFVTPSNRTYIMLGYIFAAWIAGMVMSFLTLILGEIFIISNGGKLLTLFAAFKILGIVSIIVFVFSGLSFFVIINIKSNSALMVVNTILNTFIGFFTGLFIPIGFLSKNIANIIKVFPLSYAT